VIFLAEMLEVKSDCLEIGYITKKRAIGLGTNGSKATNKGTS